MKKRTPSAKKGESAEGGGRVEKGRKSKVDNVAVISEVARMADVKTFQVEVNLWWGVKFGQTDERTGRRMIYTKSAHGGGGAEGMIVSWEQTAQTWG